MTFTLTLTLTTIALASSFFGVETPKKNARFVRAAEIASELGFFDSGVPIFVLKDDATGAFKLSKMEGDPASVSVSADPRSSGDLVTIGPNTLSLPKATSMGSATVAAVRYITQMGISYSGRISVTQKSDKFILVSYLREPAVPGGFIKILIGPGNKIERIVLGK